MYTSNSNHHGSASPSGQGYYMSQQQDQQQQQYSNDMNSYQQISRPPAAGFSSNYMKEQGSHQSLQEHLQQRETGNTGGGFTDIPTLNYPATPPPQNNYTAPNQMISTPPPSMGVFTGTITILRAWCKTAMEAEMFCNPNYLQVSIP